MTDAQRSREHLVDEAPQSVSMRKSLQPLLDSAPEDKKEQFQKEMKGFERLFKSFIDNRGNKINWSSIKPPPPGMIVNYSNLKGGDGTERSILEKLAVLKLNGGLGTTMGCQGPKSAIEVSGENTFLDLTVQQIEHLNNKHDTTVPLVLMNSFNTHEMTDKILEKYKRREHILIHTFNQSRYPRIVKDSNLALPSSYDDDKGSWYPPGHGDVFSALCNSGVLDQLLDQGREYLFISNVDNLGATVDTTILRHMVATGAEYIMEVTDKTKADIKGGTLIQYEGKAKLLEIAQVPAEHVEEFTSVKRFKIFNTNNIWVNLRAIKRLVDSGAFDNMDVIVNNKSHMGLRVVQLERAVGAAIEFFEGSHGVNVLRSRFLPVKSTSDLFMVRSNLYSESEEGCLVINPERVFPGLPFIKLGDHFKHVSEFFARFLNVPDILELDHLTVSGDVAFGKNVVLRGTVIIVANHGSRIDIPSGSILENKVVSGNLRILDH
eukprot:TRINITY_DN4425_c0_g1_i1.p1 TRINITY_DN4425_c0_g1~~TRINITY_DN4425_c0_g1_i1.p1  ORF type:complete len:514 (+),score=137.60 TRINITY_DN4425_c0_g1_i1:72-1544(+)